MKFLVDERKFCPDILIRTKVKRLSKALGIILWGPGINVSLVIQVWDGQTDQPTPALLELLHARAELEIWDRSLNNISTGRETKTDSRYCIKLDHIALFNRQIPLIKPSF